MHAPVGPSALHQYELCRGSWRLSQGFPDETSQASAEGTCAHWGLFEKRLPNGAYPTPGAKDPDGTPFTLDMGLDLESTAEFIEGVIAEATQLGERDPVVLYETRSRVGHALALPDPLLIWGTADCVIIDFVHRQLWVIDLKFGRIAVDVVNNPQLTAYALGIIHEHAIPDDWSATLVICQPRVHELPQVHHTTVEALQDRRHTLRELVLQITTPDAELPFTPGEEQCRFCRATGSCKANAEWAIAGDFEDLDRLAEITKDPAVLSDEELNALLLREKAINKFFEQAKPHAVARMAITPDCLPDFKRVETQTRLSWIETDPMLLKDALRSRKLPVSKIFQKKAVTPTQAKRIVASDPAKLRSLERLFHKPKGAPTIAPITDRREPLKGDFEELE